MRRSLRTLLKEACVPDVRPDVRLVDAPRFPTWHVACPVAPAAAARAVQSLALTLDLVEDATCGGGLVHVRWSDRAFEAVLDEWNASPGRPPEHFSNITSLVESRRSTIDFGGPRALRRCHDFAWMSRMQLHGAARLGGAEMPSDERATLRVVLAHLEALSAARERRDRDVPVAVFRRLSEGLARAVDALYERFPLLSGPDSRIRAHGWALQAAARALSMAATCGWLSASGQ